jgi:hypothetical protein
VIAQRQLLPGEVARLDPLDGSARMRTVIGKTLPIKNDAASPILDGGGNQMQINPTYAGPISPEPIRQSQPADAAHPPGDQFIATSGLADRRHAAGLDPARAERIRSRVLSGAYDTLEVVDAIARRLLEGEDL